MSPLIAFESAISEASDFTHPPTPDKDPLGRTYSRCRPLRQMEYSALPRSSISMPPSEVMLALLMPCVLNEYALALFRP